MASRLDTAGRSGHLTPRAPVQHLDGPASHTDHDGMSEYDAVAAGKAEPGITNLERYEPVPVPAVTPAGPLTPGQRKKVATLRGALDAVEAEAEGLRDREHALREELAQANRDAIEDRREMRHFAQINPTRHEAAQRRLVPLERKIGDLEGRRARLEHRLLLLAAQRTAVRDLLQRIYLSCPGDHEALFGMPRPGFPARSPRRPHRDPSALDELRETGAVAARRTRRGSK